MTQSLFEKQSKDKQFDILCAKGIPISDRKLSKIEIYLYQIEGFYVEVFYHSVTKYILIKSFSDTSLLEPYLKKSSLKIFLPEPAC